MRTGTRFASRFSFCSAMSPTGSRSGSVRSACPLRGNDDRKDLPLSCISRSDSEPRSSRPWSAMWHLQRTIHRDEAGHRFSPMDQRSDTPRRIARLRQSRRPVCCHSRVARFVALLRAVNVGKRTVAMATARQALADLGLADVSSYVNSGNLLFSGTGPVSDHEAAIRAQLEAIFGFELTTFVRTAEQVR